MVSIHAPRAGSDVNRDNRGRRIDVSIHAPRAGSDRLLRPVTAGVRRFNPRPPCGERRIVTYDAVDSGQVSIHAPRAGSDAAGCWPVLSRPGFQSTPPVRGATPRPRSAAAAPTCFNPRPPCGERRSSLSWVSRHLCFNPRPPCGERRILFEFLFLLSQFQSTPPVRGATCRRCRRATHHLVSIHAPRAGSDRVGGRVFRQFERFNPRPPCGERLQGLMDRRAID